ISEFLELEFVCRELIHELLGQVDLLLLQLGRVGKYVELVDVSDLVAVVEGGEQKPGSMRLDGGHVLPLAHHETADGHLARILEDFSEEEVGSLRLLGRSTEVEPVVVERLDLTHVDELDDLDPIRFLRSDAVELLLREGEELPIAERQCLDGVVPIDGSFASLAVALVMDRRHALLAQQLEPHRPAAYGGIQFNGDADESERYRPVPDRSHGDHLDSVS